MVEYTCKYCKKNYDSTEEAEKCEEKGLIGLDIEPGLLLSHKKVKDGFKIFYKELPSEGHERFYEFEEFLAWKSTICPVQHYRESGLDFSKSLDIYRIATKEEIEKVNKLIKIDFPGMGVIKTSLEFNKAKKVHNRLELKVA